MNYFHIHKFFISILKIQRGKNGLTKPNNFLLTKSTKSANFLFCAHNLADVTRFVAACMLKQLLLQKHVYTALDSPWV